MAWDNSKSFEKRKRDEVNYGCHNKRTEAWIQRQVVISSEMFWGLQQHCKLNMGFGIKILNDDK